MIISDERKIVLLEVIALAKERREVAVDEEILILSAAAIQDFHDSEKHKEEQLLSRAIYDYLMQLPFEDVKFVQTVMYMGRDESLEEAGNVESLYNEVYASMRWNTQEVEVGMITEKIPLDEYLSKGMELMAVLS